jgi:hypothetical protein
MKRIVLTTLCALWTVGFVHAQPEADSAKMKADLERAQRILNDWANLGRYAADNAKVGAPAAGEERVVFMGDSITDAWGAWASSFPASPTSIAASAGRRRLKC